MSAKFGFRVSHITGRRDMDGPVGLWGVALPRRCGSWNIAEATHATVVARLQDFIAEAQAALAALRRHEEFRVKPDEEDDNS